MSAEIEKQVLDNLNIQKENYIKQIAKPIIDAVTQIQEEIEAISEEAWYFKPIFQDENGFDEERVRNAHVDVVLGFHKEDINKSLSTFLKINKDLKNGVLEEIFKQCFLENDDLKPIFVDLLNDNLLPDEFNVPLETKVNKYEKELANLELIRQDIKQSKISLTMFRYDKNFEDNVKQNKIFEEAINNLIKQENSYVYIEKSEGFWYENGDTSVEPGYTIVGRPEDIEKILPKVLNILENMQDFGLNPEHKQSAVYLKLGEKAFILEQNEGKYEISFELPSQIAFTSNKLLDLIKTNPSFDSVGGTVKNGVISLSITEEQKIEIEEIIKTNDINPNEYADNDYIKIAIENERNNLLNQKEMGEITF